jgi:hypothetical protein
MRAILENKIDNTATARASYRIGKCSSAKSFASIEVQTDRIMARRAKNFSISFFWRSSSSLSSVSFELQIFQL